MTSVQFLFGLFGIEQQDIIEYESFEHAIFKATTIALQLPAAADLKNALAFVSGHDDFKLGIGIGVADAMQFDQSEHDYTAFLGKIATDWSEREDDDAGTLQLQIFKQATESNLSVYSLPAFEDHVCSLTVEELFQIFSKRIEVFGWLYMSLKAGSGNWASGSIVISEGPTYEPADLMNKKAERLQRLEAIRSVSSSNVLATLYILPDDFDAVGTLAPAPRLVERLRILQQALLLSALMDSSSVSEDRFVGKMNGYKALRFELKCLDPSFTVSNNDLNSIYNWIFGSGSVVDKIGLARNIISLHVRKTDSFDLLPNSWQAVLSSYKVYEKQNIKQYVEIRNKLSDQVLDYGKRASAVVDSFAAAFQKSALAVLTLFASVLVARFLSTTTPTARFLFFTTALSLAFIIMSLAYMFIARWEVKAQRQRLLNSYNNFKKRQEDLLTPGDVSRILNNDKDFNDDLLFISQKLTSYTCLWIVVLVVITLLVLIYPFVNNNSVNDHNFLVEFILSLIS